MMIIIIFAEATKTKNIFKICTHLQPIGIGNNHNLRCTFAFKLEAIDREHFYVHSRPSK